MITNLDQLLKEVKDASTKNKKCCILEAKIDYKEVNKQGRRIHEEIHKLVEILKLPFYEILPNLKYRGAVVKNGVVGISVKEHIKGEKGLFFIDGYAIDNPVKKELDSLVSRDPKLDFKLPDGWIVIKLN